MPEDRTKWNTPEGSIWHWRGQVAKVEGKFDTEDGLYVNLRDPDTGKSLGNYPISELGNRIEKETK